MSEVEQARVAELQIEADRRECVGRGGNTHGGPAGIGPVSIAFYVGSPAGTWRHLHPTPIVVRSGETVSLGEALELQVTDRDWLLERIGTQRSREAREIEKAAKKR